MSYEHRSRCDQCGTTTSTPTDDHWISLRKRKEIRWTTYTDDAGINDGGQDLCSWACARDYTAAQAALDTTVDTLQT